MLLVLVVGSLLLLLFLPAGIRSGGALHPESCFASAESGLRAAESAARSGGVALLRAAARGPIDQWPSSVRGLLPRVDIARPVPVGTIRPLGTELAERDQVAFAADVHRVSSSCRGRDPVELEAEIVSAPFLADAGIR